MNIDWSSAGFVSRVKNQGSCGSSWAFATTGSGESYALLRNQFANLSEQQLIDCTSSYGNKGCTIEYPPYALNYIQQQGLASQSDYPYAGVVQNCKVQGGAFKIQKFSQVYGCDGLSSAIMKNPVIIGVDGSMFQSYSYGIFSNCGKIVNLTLLLVGLF